MTPHDLHTMLNRPQNFSFQLTIDQDVDPSFIRFNHILELYSLVSTHVARIRNRARRLTGDSLFGAHVCLYRNNAAWALGWGGRLGCFLKGLESSTGNVHLATILRKSTGGDQSETRSTSSHFRSVSIRTDFEGLVMGIFTDGNPAADIEELVDGKGICAEDRPGERMAAAHCVVDVLVLSV